MQAFQPQLLAGLSSLRSPICHSQPHLPNVGPTASRRRASHVTGSSSGVLQREESFLDTGRSWTSSQPAQPEAELDFRYGSHRKRRFAPSCSNVASLCFCAAAFISCALGPLSLLAMAQKSCLTVESPTKTIALCCRHCSVSCWA